MKLLKVIALMLLVSFSVWVFSPQYRLHRLKTQWKYSSGDHHFGDYMDLRNADITLKNDTIYIAKLSFAVFESYKIGFWVTESKLTIRSFQGGETTFTDKG